MAHESVVETIEALTPTIRAECVGIDKTRVIPAPVIDALRRAGVFRLLAPREIGGHEADPLTFWRAVEAASYADGSVGWCTMIGGRYATFGGLMPASGAATIFGDNATIAAGAFRPDGGAAIEVDGGYRVTGRWGLGSGSSHANWYIAGCVVVRDGKPAVAPSGAPVMREVFLPASDVTIIDTWDSTGLRGTASHDYAVSDVFVPTERTLWFQEPPACRRSLYRMPPIAMFATFIGAVPLGIARHAVDEFVAFARGKTPIAGGLVAEKPVAQSTLGRAHALVTSGRVYLQETLRDLWSRVDGGHAPTLADRGSLWLAATHSAQSALQAVELLYGAAGATAVYASSPLDRCLRDARTAVQHITLQQTNYELAGRRLTGSPEPPRIWLMDSRGEG